MYQLIIDPFDVTHFLAAIGQTIQTSHDSGATWQNLQLVPQGFAFDAARQGVVFAAGQWNGTNGIYRSSDGGVTWKALTPLPSGIWPPMTPDPTRPGTVYAGDGIHAYRSTDDGATWQEMTSAGAVSRLYVGADATLFGATVGLSMEYSRDGGITWTVLPLPTSISGPVGLDAASSAVLYVWGDEEQDGYVAKYSNTGALLWLTYLGGVGRDTITALAVHPDGSIYVGGDTSSPAFPFTEIAARTPITVNGAFVARLTADGQTVTFAAQIAAANTSVVALAVDGQGRAIAGCATFSGLPQPHQSVLPSFPPIPTPVYFVTRLTAPGSSLDWVTSVFSLQANAMTVDPSGKVWLAATGLTTIDDAGVPKYFPQPSVQSFQSLSLAKNGDLLVAGLANLPLLQATAGTFQSSLGGYYQNIAPFVGRVEPTTASLSRTTFLDKEAAGGTLPLAIIEDAAERIVVAGSTGSQTLPTRLPVQGSFYIEQAGFLARLTGDLSDADQFTYAGDARPFYVNAIATGEDDIVFAGQSVRDSAVFLAQWIPAAPVGDLRLDSVLNAASRQAVPVAAGEVVTLTGDSFRDDARVYFDDTPAIISFRNWKEIRVTAPASLTTQSITRVRVEAGGQVSNSVLMPVAPASPALYTGAGLGWDFALAWREDGTAVTPQSPVLPGTIISVAVNGVNPANPPQIYINSIPVEPIGIAPAATSLTFRIPEGLLQFPPYIQLVPSRTIPIAVTDRL